jgi:hypothetical protein
VVVAGVAVEGAVVGVGDARVSGLAVEGGSDDGAGEGAVRGDGPAGGVAGFHLADAGEQGPA